MGILKVGAGAAASVLEDSWRETADRAGAGIRREAKT